MKTWTRLLPAMLLGTAATAISAQQPIADFVKHATYSDVRISPNGEYLAMTVDKGDQDVLVVLRTVDLSLVKVNQLPDEQPVGMRVFGATQPTRAGAELYCNDSQNVAPVATDNREALNAAIDAYEPYGETPIAFALQEAGVSASIDEHARGFLGVVR